MWQRVLVVMTVFFIASQGETEAVKVHVAGGLVDVEARATALSEVLAQLAEATGMRVVYEGPPPRQRITINLKQRTPADVVAAILEGLGLRYGLTIQEAGGRVQTLVLSTSPTTTGRAGRPETPGPEEPGPEAPGPEGAAEPGGMPQIIDPEGPHPSVPNEFAPVLNPEVPRFPDSPSMPAPQDIQNPLD
jgi:hypothetical protein